MCKIKLGISNLHNKFFYFIYMSVFSFRFTRKIPYSRTQAILLFDKGLFFCLELTAHPASIIFETK